MAMEHPQRGLQPSSVDRDFEAFVSPYIQRLYRFLALRLGDERDRPWSWLVGIAAHKASDSARRRSRATELTGFEAAYEEGDTGDVLAALQRLPAPAREVLLLRYLLRLSEVEVADVLGVRLGTVKSRAARARQQLLEELG